MSSLFRRNGRGNWFIQWYEGGKKRRKSTGTKDRRLAARILAQLDAGSISERWGIVDSVSPSPPIQGDSGALAGYLAELRLKGRSEGHLGNVKTQVEAVAQSVGASRVVDLDQGRVTAFLGELAKTKSPRTVNAYRQTIRAFSSWAGHEGLARLSKVREVIVRKRRELTDDELARLFEVSEEAGRGLFYRVAFYAGLRRSEIRALRWGDIDLVEGSLSVIGKARRMDLVPLHPHLRVALGPRGLPAAHVLPTIPSNTTRQKDYRAASIQLVDSRGRVADLHSLRTTLHMRLVRAGVAPQVCQRIMRHSDYRTTLAAYTDSLATEAREAIGKVAL